MLKKFLIVAVIVFSAAAILNAQKTSEAEPVVLLDCAHQDVLWKVPLWAKAFVRDRIADPKKAKFGEQKSYAMPSDDENLCQFTVFGTMTAPNSYGAMVWGQYAVTIQYDRAADAWSPVEVAIDG